MSRGLIVLVAMTRVAYAQDAPPMPPAVPPAAPTTPTTSEAPPAVASAEPSPGVTAQSEPSKAPPDMSDQAIAASLGVAIGGRTTPGGLRVAGTYLYQLSAEDWFDGTASFTFGSGDGACFRDRMDALLCDHGLADGYSVELAANVRRFFGGSGQFWPFLRAGIGVALVRFSGDEISGVAFPLHLGGGLRVSVSDGIAVVGQAELDVGIAAFGRGVGAEPQLGLNVLAGAEFRL